MAENLNPPLQKQVNKHVFHNMFVCLKEVI